MVSVWCPGLLGEAGKCEVLEGRGGLYEGLYGTIVKKSVWVVIKHKSNDVTLSLRLSQKIRE